MLSLSDAARRWLLEAARQAVDAASRGKAPAALDPPADLPASDREALQLPRAVFVTLTKRGRLRGCVGRTGFDTSLIRTVIEMAEAAACEDARFEPVQPQEVPELQIEISILSSFFRIAPHQIEPGRHGLLVQKGLRRGLLLPQVATTYHWNLQQFLAGVCQKAGLPPDAWKHGASLEAFTADVISEQTAEAA
jgi:AmmeMemoRadiSam system protein A